MNTRDSTQLSEALLRGLDGDATPSEREAVNDWPRKSPAARDYARDLAEQAVLASDLLGMAAPQSAQLAAHSSPTKNPTGRFRWLALGALLCLAPGFVFRSGSPHPAARVSQVHGATQVFGTQLPSINRLHSGATLQPGDTLETSSCDAWVALDLENHNQLTVTGASVLRFQQESAAVRSLNLVSGNLWISPVEGQQAGPLRIETPAATVRGTAAQFDLRVESARTLLRVNQGSVEVERVPDGARCSVQAGEQVTVALGSEVPLSGATQPLPSETWSARIETSPRTILGTWLPGSTGPNMAAGEIVGRDARIKAVPSLWPVGPEKQVTLFAVALPVWKPDACPIVLNPDAYFTIRGKIDQPRTVRFGFSVQRTRGVFAGKFELDVPPEQLKPAQVLLSDMDYTQSFALDQENDDGWEVTLPLSQFKQLYPSLPEVCSGLELNDVYVLTIEHDVGLEIVRLDLEVPPVSPEFEPN